MRARAGTQRGVWVTDSDRLRDIQALTDAEFSYLDAEAQLQKLLERVKVIMRADTAALLLLNRAGTELVATMAVGLEEEVRQDMRIPVGRGFAGRVAAQAAPVILDRVDHSTVINPILIDKGIRALVGVPLLVGGRVVGVLHAGSLSTRAFTGDDAELLQLAADRAASAVQSVRSRSDRAAALALVRSLLPESLPTVDGLEIAARYAPREAEVGGDWYDVFSLPTGELCAVMGDVAGAGLRAAVTMGRMRSVVRAYALETADPAEVLRRLDRKMLHFEPDIIATVQYAVFDRDLEHVRISSAGHVPPVIAEPGRPAVLADVGGDPLIGLSKTVSRTSCRIPLRPGAVLCLYTDGLVERPGMVIDEGMAALCRAISAGSPDAVCAAAMAMPGRGPRTDDTTVLAFRRSEA